MASYFISMGIAVILEVLKDEAERRKYERALLKVRDAITAAFAAGGKMQ